MHTGAGAKWPPLSLLSGDGAAVDEEFPWAENMPRSFSGRGVWPCLDYLVMEGCSVSSKMSEDDYVF